ncbi:MAG: flagellar brake protein [Bacillota bacterium]
MELEDLIKQEVGITKEVSDFDDLSDTCSGRVLDIQDKELIIRSVDAIAELGLQIGDQLQVLYTDQARGIYYFRNQVRNLDQPRIKLQRLEELQKYQRRDFVRVNYQTEIKFSPISYQGENLTHLEEKQGLGEMVDISAGGLCFIAGIELMEELVIELNFELAGEAFQVLGKVVRVIEQEEGYELGVQFDIKDKSVRDRISSFVFQQQIKQRRRERRNK